MQPKRVKNDLIGGERHRMAKPQEPPQKWNEPACFINRKGISISHISWASLWIMDNGY